MRIKCVANCKNSQYLPMFVLPVKTIVLLDDMSPAVHNYTGSDPRDIKCMHCKGPVKLDGHSAAGTRILLDPISIKHADLDACTPEIDVFRSDCPICEGGLLLGERAKDSYKLLSEDRCTLCGQRFIYTDMEEFMKGGQRNV